MNEPELPLPTVPETLIVYTDALGIEDVHIDGYKPGGAS